MTTFEVDKRGRVVIDEREQRVIDLLTTCRGHSSDGAPHTFMLVDALVEATGWGPGLTLHILHRLMNKGLITKPNPYIQTPLEWVALTDQAVELASDSARAMSLLGARRC